MIALGMMLLALAGSLAAVTAAVAQTPVPIEFPPLGTRWINRSVEQTGGILILMVAGARAPDLLSRLGSTDAIPVSVPGTKLAMMSTCPSESLVDSKFRMPLAPFSSSSISRVTLL